jgi:hypothetical protein
LETDISIEDNVCCIDYADTWSSKQVYLLWKSKSPHCGTSDYGCEETLELHTRVARAPLPIPGIQMWVASKPKIYWILATLNNLEWMDNCQICYGSIEAISILDHLEVEEACSDIPSRYHSVQSYVPSHGWHDASFGQVNDSMEGRLVLHCEATLTEAVQILCQSDSNKGKSAHFCTYPRSFPDVAIG